MGLFHPHRKVRYDDFSRGAEFAKDVVDACCWE